MARDPGRRRLPPATDVFFGVGLAGDRGASEGGLRLRTYLLLRAIREGVNNLLPFAQIGGEFVVARLVHKRGVRLAQAIGGTIADLLMEMGTQILFTVLGIALLVHSVGHSDVSDLATRALMIAALVVAGAFVALWLGLAAVIGDSGAATRTLVRVAATAEIGGLHTALTHCFRAPGNVTLAAVWHLVSWLLGGIEVCLVLHFFGIDVGIGAGLIIESLGQALKAVGFAVPGAIRACRRAAMSSSAACWVSHPRPQSPCLS